MPTPSAVASVRIVALQEAGPAFAAARQDLAQLGQTARTVMQSVAAETAAAAGQQRRIETVYTESRGGLLTLAGAFRTTAAAARELAGTPLSPTLAAAQREIGALATTTASDLRRARVELAGVGAAATAAGVEQRGLLTASQAAAAAAAAEGQAVVQAQGRAAEAIGTSTQAVRAHTAALREAHAAAGRLAVTAAPTARVPESVHRSPASGVAPAPPVVAAPRVGAPVVPPPVLPSVAAIPVAVQIAPAAGVDTLTRSLDSVRGAAVEVRTELAGVGPAAAAAAGSLTAFQPATQDLRAASLATTALAAGQAEVAASVSAAAAPVAEYQETIRGVAQEAAHLAQSADLSRSVQVSALELAELAQQAEKSLGDVGARIVALSQKQRELNAAQFLGQMPAEQLAQAYAAVRAEAVSLAGQVAIGSREHEKLADVAGRAANGLKTLGAAAREDVTAAIGQLAARQRELNEAHARGDVNARDYERGLKALQSDLTAMSQSLTAGSREAERLGQINGQVTASLRDLAAGSTMLAQRVRELTNAHSLGEVEGRQYEQALKSIRNEAVTLAAQVQVGSAEHQRLGQIAGQVTSTLTSLGRAEARNVDGMEALSAASLSLSSVMQGNVGAVGSLTNVMQRFMKNSPWMVGVIGGVGALAVVLAEVWQWWRRNKQAAEEAQKAARDGAATFANLFRVARRPLSDEERIETGAERVADIRRELDRLPDEVTVQVRYGDMGGGAVGVLNQEEIDAARALNAETARRRERLQGLLTLTESIVGQSQTNLEINRQQADEDERRAAALRAQEDLSARIRDIESERRRNEMSFWATFVTNQNARLQEEAIAARVGPVVPEVVDIRPIELRPMPLRVGPSLVDSVRTAIADAKADILAAADPEFKVLGVALSTSLFDAIGGGLLGAQRALDQAGLLRPISGFFRELAGSVGSATGELRLFGVASKETQGQWDGLAMTVASTVESGLVESIASSLGSGARGISGFGRQVASVIGDTVITMGKGAIGIGLGAEALSKALKNIFGGGGLAAVAVGAGLVLLGNQIKGVAGGAASQLAGGFGGNAGANFGGSFGAGSPSSQFGGVGRGGDVIVEVPDYDPRDPRYLDWFVRMMEQLTGRDVIVRPA